MSSDTTRWRTSSYSGSQGGNCIEVAGRDRRVLVRDTKNRSGAVLRFSPQAWRTFTGRSRQPRSARTVRMIGPPSGCVKVALSLRW